MSDSDRPDVRAFRELEALVRHLGEELAAFRRRAIAAEAELGEARSARSHGGGGHGGVERGTHAHAKTKSAGGNGRVAELEAENHALKSRLDRAEDRVRQMMDRVRFLRQQLQTQSGALWSRS